MAVYNVYLALNNELIMIYDEQKQMVLFEGLSNTIPFKLMNRYVHNLYIKRINGYNYLLIGID